MTSAVPAIDLSPLQNAFSQLSEALTLWEAEPQASVLKRHLRAAAIQSFEFTYELALRMLRRVLIERALATDLVQDLSFNDLLRAGADAGLVADQQAWRRWRAMRNITSHTYDESKAQEVAESLTAFKHDAFALMQGLALAAASHA